MLDDVLQERVLAALGRSRIGLDREDLLAEEAGEQGLELFIRQTGERLQPQLGEGLAEHGAVLDEPALVLGQAVEAGGDQGVQGLRHLERLDRPGGFVDVPLLHEEPSVEQHAHGLDRVQWHALGAGEDSLAQLVRQAGDETRQQLAHRLRRQRLQVKGGEAALADAPARSLVGELRTRERDHQEGVAARPFEQVLEEVEQAGIRPLHVLEHEDRRRLLCEPLEEDPPGREQVLLVAGRALLEPEQVGETGLDPAPLLRVQDVQLDRRAQLSER